MNEAKRHAIVIFKNIIVPSYLEKARLGMMENKNEITCPYSNDKDKILCNCNDCNMRFAAFIIETFDFKKNNNCCNSCFNVRSKLSSEEGVCKSCNNFSSYRVVQTITSEVEAFERRKW